MAPVAIGDAVVFVDELGKPHEALVTAVHGAYHPPGGSDAEPMPSLNVVYVSGDELKYDSYGRQIQRETSVVHRSSQPAHGMFWEEIPSCSQADVETP